MTVAVLGEALVDLIATSEGAFHAHLGGSPYNVAIALARQGAAVHYISPLSDDDFGDQLHAALTAEHVTLPLTRRSAWPTSMALVKIDNEGQANYRLYREGVADKDIELEELLTLLPSNLRLFHTGSLAITPSQLPKIRGLFKALRRRGVPISIDLNIRLKGSIDREQYLAGVRSLLPLVDIVKASDEDLAAFELSRDASETAELFYSEMIGGMLILTRGAHGASLLSSNGWTHTSGQTVERLGDTVGAGDTFHAAFLSQLLNNAQSEDDLLVMDAQQQKAALQFASTAAAINVGRIGCCPPYRAEVIAQLEQ